MAKKKTHKKFEEQLEKINKNITILTNYDGTHSYIGCQCLIDGHIWKTTPANLLQKHGCPKCSARKLSEEKIFLMEMNEPMCKNKVPREGLVIRIFDDEKEEAFKIKCKKYMFREAELIDEGEIDMEMEEGYSVEN